VIPDDIALKSETEYSQSQLPSMLKQVMLNNLVMVAAFQEYEHARMSRLDTSMKVFQATLIDAALIAGGLKTGGCWKDELTGTETIADILTIAHTPNKGLTKGPGKRVQDLKSLMADSVMSFKKEVAKVGLLNDPEVQKAIAEADRLAKMSQVSAFESQLARSLVKATPQERKTSCEKYCALYAHVSEDDVHPLLLAEGKKHL
jgi:hypothetical protein